MHIKLEIVITSGGQAGRTFPRESSARFQEAIQAIHTGRGPHLINTSWGSAQLQTGAKHCSETGAPPFVDAMFICS